MHQRQGVSAGVSRDEDLLSTIEQQVIPRLVLTHCADYYRQVALRPAKDHRAEQQLCVEAMRPPSAEEVGQLALLAATQPAHRSVEFVVGLCQQGLDFETVFLDLIGPAAETLGQQWLDDQRSFTEVSLGLGTLQHIVHVLSPSAQSPFVHRGLVLLCAASGEQHTLGLYLVAELLRKAGWGVHVQPNLPESELLHLVESQSVVMVGITASTLERCEGIESLIERLRRASLNPNLAIMLGGCADLKQVATRCGAIFCSNAQEAVELLPRYAQNGSVAFEA